MESDIDSITQILEIYSDHLGSSALLECSHLGITLTNASQLPEVILLNCQHLGLTLLDEEWMIL
jgi:hypothetical protein